MRSGQSQSYSGPLPAMSHVEELPDDFDELRILNPFPKSAPVPRIPPTAASVSTPSPVKSNGERRHGTTTPSLPPQMASVRSHTTDEIMQMMSKTPLFMTSLDDAGNDGMQFEIVTYKICYLMTQARWGERRARSYASAAI